jgi:phospholipid/cholesterol/gamma-HCH transport system substrate-binding protein
MSPNKRNLMVGVVVIGGIVTLAWMVLKFANRAANFFLTKGTHVTVIADRADGVSEGSAVYYRGVNVGRVLDVTLKEDQTVHVGIIIDKDRPVPADVEGVIRTGNLLSASASIFLEPVHLVAEQVDPNANAPTSKPTRMLKEGDVLKATMPTGNALLPREFNETLREFQERKMLQHVDEAVVTIREQSVKVGQLMDSMREITGDEKMRGDLRKTAANMQEATAKANAIADNLNTFSTDLNGLRKQASDTITEVQATVGDARKTINKTGDHVDELSRNINGKIDQIGKVLEQFETVTARMQRGEGTAGKLFTDPRLYESMADAAAELNLMVGDLRRLVQQWEQEGISFKMGK